MVNEDDDSLAERIYAQQIEPQLIAADLRARGVNVDIAFVNHDDVEGVEVQCEGCGRVARTDSTPPPSAVVMCPRCLAAAGAVPLQMETMPAGGDPMVVAMRLSLAALCRTLNEDGWDQNPTLWAAYRDMVEGEPAFLLDFVPVAGQETFSSLDTKPSDLLAVLASYVEQENGLAGAPPGIFAFVFASEAYMSTNFENPERDEVRIIGAVDRGGFHYAYIHVRETGEVTIQSGRPGEGTDYLSGYVMDSLRRLIEACPSETDWG
jgi:hypothetical protein